MRVFALLGLLFCSGVQSAWYSETQAIMGTEVSVQLWANSQPEAEHHILAAMQEFRRIDETYSPYIETSDLAVLNSSAFEKRVEVSDEMWHLLQKAQSYSKRSSGAFDITFASVGFYYDYRKQQQPEASLLEKLKDAIDYRQIRLINGTNAVQYGHKDTRIDLGGIAKGFAVDKVKTLLAERGVVYAAISAGGDSTFLGDKAGKPWMVGIQHPREEALAIVLPMEDFAMSTSGDYERYFIDEQTQQRVHHIIDPQSGRSATPMGSVTVIGPHGIDTDALSTSVFVLGVEKGLALLETMPLFDGVIIEANGAVHYSSGLMPPEQTAAN